MHFGLCDEKIHPVRRSLPYHNLNTEIRLNWLEINFLLQSLWQCGQLFLPKLSKISTKNFSFWRTSTTKRHKKTNGKKDICNTTISNRLRKVPSNFQNTQLPISMAKYIPFGNVFPLCHRLTGMLLYGFF